MAKWGEGALESNLASMPGELHQAILSGMSAQGVQPTLAAAPVMESPSLEDRVPQAPLAAAESAQGMEM